MNGLDELLDYDEVMATHDVVIGLEVHVELDTKSKMWCGCSTDFGAAPNSHTCPVCLGLPGSLPVVNRTAVESAIRIGLSLGCQIAEWCRFARKNYFYPDMTKNYQISQYDEPLCFDGEVVIVVDGQPQVIPIERVHMEEDAGKTSHVGGAGRIQGADYSLLDYNRAGVPLMEIVTKPVLGTGTKAPEVAREYMAFLRELMRALGVSQARMERGNMRCDANVSLMPKGSDELGTRTETKNINSLKSVEAALRYEICRQGAVLKRGGRVVQETRMWHEEGYTTAGRSKETAEDYRYFPEPDLPPVELDDAQRQAIAARLPELPDAKRRRFVAELGIREEDARLLTEDRSVADYCEETVQAATGRVPAQIVANWMVGEIFRLLRDSGQEIGQINVRPQGLAELLGLLQEGAINGTVAKEVLDEMFASGADAGAIVERRGLRQINDQEALAAAVRDVIAAHPGPVQQYLDGKQQVLGFLIGQVMRATRGQANVQIVTELLNQELARLR